MLPTDEALRDKFLCERGILNGITGTSKGMRQTKEPG